MDLKENDGFLSFELNEATEDEYLVSYGNSFQDLIVDGKRLLQYDVVLKIGILCYMTCSQIISTYEVQPYL